MKAMKAVKKSPAAPAPSMEAMKPMKRKSGKSMKSTEYEKGVKRKPLLRKAEFSESRTADLDKHGFNPPQQNFLPDGRWTVETRANGGRVKLAAFHVSFD